MLRGGWFVYSSQSLPFPAILPTLSVGQVAGGLVPTAVLLALLAWVLPNPCYAGTLIPKKPHRGLIRGMWGHWGLSADGALSPCQAGLEPAAAAECQLPAMALQPVLPGAEACALAAPGAGKSHGWQDLRAELGLGRGV